MGLVLTIFLLLINCSDNFAFVPRLSPGIIAGLPHSIHGFFEESLVHGFVDSFPYEMSKSFVKEVSHDASELLDTFMSSVFPSSQGFEDIASSLFTLSPNKSSVASVQHSSFQTFDLQGFLKSPTVISIARCVLLHAVLHSILHSVSEGIVHAATCHVPFWHDLRKIYFKRHVKLVIRIIIHPLSKLFVSRHLKCISGLIQPFRFFEKVLLLSTMFM